MTTSTISRSKERWKIKKVHENVPKVSSMITKKFAILLSRKGKMEEPLYDSLF